VKFADVTKATWRSTTMHMACRLERFTDAHCAAAVCTPGRYALLIGQYAWRHAPARGILSGVAPLAIPLDRLLLPSSFRRPATLVEGARSGYPEGTSSLRALGE
jgi:hypothetical protein